MGINKQSLILLLQADREQQIAGNFLTLGYNTVTIKYDDILALGDIYKKDIDESWLMDPINQEATTKHSTMLGYAPVDQNKLLKKTFSTHQQHFRDGQIWI